MKNARFYASSRGDAMFCYPLVGVYRHDRAFGCRQKYRVVICIDHELIADAASCFDAVMDDFGNLVRVQ